MTFRTIGPLISRMPHDYLMSFSSLFSHKTLLLALFLSKSHRNKASYDQPEYLHLQEDAVLKRRKSVRTEAGCGGEMKVEVPVTGRMIAAAVSFIATALACEWPSLQAVFSEITLKYATRNNCPGAAVEHKHSDISNKVHSKSRLLY